MGFSVQILNRRGRKRKQGYRKPSGDLVAPEKREDARVVVMMQPHRKWAQSVEDRQDARCETPFGILNMRETITAEQYLAGKYYAADVHRYRRIVDPPAAMKSNFVFATRDDPMPDHERMPVEIRSERDITPEMAERWTAKYNEAFAAASPAGHKALRALARMCVHGEKMPDGSTLAHLLEGLNLLVIHYGLKNKAST